jgi:hypothetical protein
VTASVHVPVSGELRRSRVALVVATVLATDPTLTTAQVETAIAAVAGHPAALRSLSTALAADRSALRTGAPPMVGRLVQALRAGGATSLAEPSCAVCSRAGLPLTRSSTIGGVCARCRRRKLAEACARCCIVKPVAGRDSEGHPVCARCADRPQRECGRCGRTRRIARRAHDGLPDICDACYQMPTARCGRCHRERQCSFATGPEPICLSCASRATAVCAHCGADRPPTARWPEGPVCEPCYTKALRHRGTCSGCHTQRRLVSPPGPDANTCADCAGLPRTHICTDCGREDKLYARGRCNGCALSRRTGDLLRAGAEVVPAPLVAVHDAIIATSTPRTALNWLRKGAGAAVLADLAAGTTALSHAALDAHPRRRGADYLRHVLVAADVLEARDEPLARIETWVATVLTDVKDAEHRRLLHTYATWQVLRRLRRRAAAHNATGQSPTSYPRTQLLVATRFLAWLGQRGLTLGQCRQGEVDNWLADGTAGYPVRDFLGWAAEHHHCPVMLVPAAARTTGTAIDADERWELLARLLHDDTLELTDRVAGALLLCYGQQLSRIAAMTTEQVHRQHDPEIVSLRFGAHDIIVAEPLSGLLSELVDVGRRSHRGVGSPATSPWLFPGHLPGRPVTASRLGERLRLLGVRALPARRATLVQLAAEVPAAVLAELLNLTPGTATRWTRDAGADWSRYAAELARRRDHQP